MTICFSNQKGISFVELMVCIIITALLFGLIYKFMANTRYNYMYGVVNLQNLQEARLAINYIRRDFSSACPRFEDPNEDSQNGYINLQKSSKTLTRTSETKGMKVFSGIEDVNFALYTHEMNPNVPLLWVQLVIHESENMYGSSEIGKALELTTTISSSFINSSQNNKYWRYETGHEK